MLFCSPPHHHLPSKHLHTSQVKQLEPEAHHSTLNAQLGALWRCMSDEEKQPFVDKAREAKEQHAAEHPLYRYRPRQPVQDEVSSSSPSADVAASRAQESRNDGKEDTAGTQHSSRLL